MLVKGILQKPRIFGGDFICRLKRFLKEHAPDLFPYRFRLSANKNFLTS